MAWVGAGSEFVTANRAAIRSALVTRLLVPGSTLVLALAWVASPLELTPSRGVLCYGAGWLLGLATICIFLRQTTREEVRAAPAEHRTREWLTSIWPFLYFALLISVLAKVGVIILELVATDEATVAVYSAAAETGTFIYIVAKSTDKLYLPVVSTMLERQDQVGLHQGRRGRWVWLGSICAGFLLVVFLFGKQILGLFGQEFIEGYPALCIIAAATAVWTMASLAPAYLKYVQRQRFVVVGTSLAVLAHVGLCIPLGYRFGATGAAVSYALPVIALYLTMAVVATRELRRLGASEAGRTG
jgi:O-antigen/teichoic acid export membrane protein